MQLLDLVFSLVAAAMIALLVGAVARDAWMRLSALSVAGFVIVAVAGGKLLRGRSIMATAICRAAIGER